MHVDRAHEGRFAAAGTAPGPAAGAAGRGLAGPPAAAAIPGRYDRTMLHEARYWEPAGDGRVLCTLCPRACRIGEGQAGFCYIRRNQGGRLVTAGYGRSTGFAVDPIEKKPLAHYLPGSKVLSFGTAGCCLGCRFCQNWDISKARQDERLSEDEFTPERVVELAVELGAPGIAFTYNDPIIWAEYAIDVAEAAHARGLFTVFVTSGYVEPRRPRGDLPAHGRDERGPEGVHRGLLRARDALAPRAGARHARVAREARRTSGWR